MNQSAFEAIVRPVSSPVMTTLDAALRRIIAAYCHGRGMSTRRFGQLSVADSSLGTTLARGRSPRLETVDRLLAFIGAEPIGPAFTREVEAFLDATGTKPSALGARAAGDPSFVSRLRRGASPRLATVEQVREWMHAAASETERSAMAAALEGATVSGLMAAAADATAAPTDSLTQGDRSMHTPLLQQESTYLSTREAAAFLGLSPRTLDRYRVTGEGPPFFKFGSRVRYLKADLEAWAQTRRRRSTSDDGLSKAA